MTFKKIEEVTGVSTSTASDIWRHALANARRARLAVTTVTPTVTILPPVATPSFLSAAPAAAAVPIIGTPRAPVLSVLLSASAVVPTTIPSSSDTPGPDNEFSLMELIAASVLDSDARSGRPPSLSEGDKDKLVKLVKKDFITRRMTLCDFRREAGLSHVSDTTVYRALKERGIGPYPEVFKFILSTENKEKRLVSNSLQYNKNLNRRKIC